MKNELKTVGLKNNFVLLTSQHHKHVMNKQTGFTQNIQIDFYVWFKLRSQERKLNDIE